MTTHVLADLELAPQFPPAPALVLWYCYDCLTPIADFTADTDDYAADDPECPNCGSTDIDLAVEDSL